MTVPVPIIVGLLASRLVSTHRVRRMAGTTARRLRRAGSHLQRHAMDALKALANSRRIAQLPKRTCPSPPMMKAVAGSSFFATPVFTGTPLMAGCAQHAQLYLPAQASLAGGRIFRILLGLLVMCGVAALGVLASRLHAELKRARERARAECSAATRLQSVSRRRRAYLFLRSCYQAVLRLQEACRARAALRAAAATTIQRHARRMSARNHFLIVLAATIRTQCAFRRWTVGGAASAAFEARALLRGELSARQGASLRRRMVAAGHLHAAARKLEAGCCAEAAHRLTRVVRGHLDRQAVRALRSTLRAQALASAKAKGVAARHLAARRTLTRGRHVARAPLVALDVNDDNDDGAHRQLFLSPQADPTPPQPPTRGSACGAVPPPPALAAAPPPPPPPPPRCSPRLALRALSAHELPAHREPLSVPGGRGAQPATSAEEMRGRQMRGLLRELELRLASRRDALEGTSEGHDALEGPATMARVHALRV